MRFLLMLLFLSSNVYADEGINISCKKLLSEHSNQPLKSYEFKLDSTSFQYFDEKKNKFVVVSTKNLIIKEDFFSYRLRNYEFGFQVILFYGEKRPRITMSKYDYINNRFIDHYNCDVKRAYID